MFLAIRQFRVNHNNTCDYITKGAYAKHIIDYSITLQWNLDIWTLQAKSTMQIMTILRCFAICWFAIVDFAIWASSPHADSPYISQFTIWRARARKPNPVGVRRAHACSYGKSAYGKLAHMANRHTANWLWRIDYGESANGETMYSQLWHYWIYN